MCVCVCDHLFFPVTTDVKICLAKSHTFSVADGINNRIMKNIRSPKNDNETATAAAYLLHTMGNQGLARLIATIMIDKIQIMVPLFSV